MNYIDALNKRYSVKRFNPDKTVSRDTLQHILDAGRLSASALGLQPYEIYVVESEQRKRDLIPAFHNPSQISTCSHMIVIVAKNSIRPQYIGNYFSHISDTREIPVDSLEPFRKSIGKHIDQLTTDEVLNWAEKQCYIVLGNLMFAAALESVDTCPMEGFKPQMIEQILGIDTETEKVAVTLALGYRADDDHYQNLKKVRKPNERLFKFI